MLKFKINKEKSDSSFEVSECLVDTARVTIIKGKKNGLVSVFVRRDVYDENYSRVGFIEIWDHSPKNYTEAKRIWEKLLDITLWYKPLKWLEKQ